MIKRFIKLIIINFMSDKQSDKSEKQSKEDHGIVYEHIKNEVDKVLKRPEVFIGSVEYTSKENVWYLSKNKIQNGKRNMNDGLERIFMEPLYNIIDVCIRIREKEQKGKCTKIKINIDEKGKCTFYNDGPTVPIEKKNIVKDSTDANDITWIPETIFGSTWSSSNYKDTKKRKTSGLNGLGVKLSNICSVYFKLEIYDLEKDLLYVQTWTNNTKNKTEPIITKQNKKYKNGFTRITFLPDFKYFGKLDNFHPDIISVLQRYVIECSMITGVKTFFNGKKIKIRELSDYVDLYSSESNDNKESSNSQEKLLLKSDTCQVAVLPYNGYSHNSFVNGCNTHEGGIHVDAWVEAVCRPIVDKFNKTENKITIKDVKSHLLFIVLSDLDRPKFDSQSKTKLKSSSSEIKPIVEKSQITKLLKWEFTRFIKDSIKAKDLKKLKTLEKKKNETVYIDKHIPANKLSSEPERCVLFICEGLSASTAVRKGFQTGIKKYKCMDNKLRKITHDYLGVYPIQGKICNVRNVSANQIKKSKEINSIFKILNLKIGADYTDEKTFKTLAYQDGLVIMTDADTDGSHITGLILNMFHVFFPTLLKIGYVREMLSPITAFNIKGKYSFYYDRDESDKQTLLTNIRPDYLKGLGSSKDEYITSYFGKRMVQYILDEKADKTLYEFFCKKESNTRKVYIQEYVSDKGSNQNGLFTLDDNTTKEIPITDFCKTRLTEYSKHSIKRAIPSIIDGLKDVQRKAVYSAIMKKLAKKVIKVKAITGYAIDNVQYHHGDTSIDEAIIGLTQSFVGSNNIPIFEPDGQFGSRNENGDDHADARYVSLKAHELFDLIFRKEDYFTTPHNIDDGIQVEFKYILPIIPIILVNGCYGVATGWKTDIPNYNPLDIVAWIKNYLTNTEKPKLIPWYRGFKGTIEKYSKGKYVTKGIFSYNDNVYTITELPVKVWTNTFRKTLNTNESISKIQDKCNDLAGTVKFTFKANKSFDISELPLESKISTTNLVLFNIDDKITSYKKPEEIMTEFCEFRLYKYTLRKQKLLEEYSLELLYISNKLRFINEILEKTIVLDKKKKSEVCKELSDKKYDIKIDKRNKNEKEDSDDESDNQKGNYNYLLSMQIMTITLEKYNKLLKEKEKINAKIHSLKNKKEQEMWIQELDEFTDGYNAWINKFKEKQNKPDKQK